MFFRVWCVAVVLSTGCYVPPNEDQEQVRCYQACGREKDSCMLAATNAAQVQRCDERSSRCSAVCE